MAQPRRLGQPQGGAVRRFFCVISEGRFAGGKVDVSRDGAKFLHQRKALHRSVHGPVDDQALDNHCLGVGFLCL
jgi:hypothetical protein